MLSVALTVAPATLPKGKLDCYALNNRLCGPQSGSGIFEKQKLYLIYYMSVIHNKFISP
jgi:hypothetical protein